ncbi:OmpH family outer membrane protein [Pelagibacteraceae bacterium]|nr:OmpH family outer membrane protein [Pelagibacteraceae bacterium]
MKKIKILLLFLILIYPFNLMAENQVYFINLKKVLNESKAGSAAQEKLVKEFENQDKKFKNEANTLKKQETELINQRKTLSADEYKKKVSSLRKKNVDFQNRRRDASSNFVKKKNNARNQLLKSLNPILQKYMDENGIMMIMNEKNVILANSKVDLTNTIIDLLNKELKSIKLN